MLPVGGQWLFVPCPKTHRRFVLSATATASVHPGILCHVGRSAAYQVEAGSGRTPTSCPPRPTSSSPPSGQCTAWLAFAPYQRTGGVRRRSISSSASFACRTSPTRKWIDLHGDGGPFGRSSMSLPPLSWATREELLDRYNQHTVHCASCSGRYEVRRRMRGLCVLHIRRVPLGASLTSLKL